MRVIFGLHICPTVEAKLRQMLSHSEFRNVAGHAAEESAPVAGKSDARGGDTLRAQPPDQRAALRRLAAPVGTLDDDQPSPAASQIILRAWPLAEKCGTGASPVRPAAAGGCATAAQHIASAAFSQIVPAFARRALVLECGAEDRVPFSACAGRGPNVGENHG